MPYVEMTAADLPNYRVCRIVLDPDTYDPRLVPDRLVYAAREGGYVHGATRDGRFTIEAAAPVLIDPES
ncbi:hypothetical protein HMPREF2604_07505 [Corynebacterium sp. HMSC055A01]|uniref:hypothetical protein n=1 Tax=Corynebacterium sp. HMSC055A01 TaxID=1715083 RepID=UPI0008A177C8|nr:hypothetical protein [Corynebacterium sp. HMSC055A01]OFN17778.1 hypothetical protein HMPREF2604_07505 [Corynebacterium sp. HMSC055A01]